MSTKKKYSSGGGSYAYRPKNTLSRTNARETMTTSRTTKPIAASNFYGGANKPKVRALPDPYKDTKRNTSKKRTDENDGWEPTIPAKRSKPTSRAESVLKGASPRASSAVYKQFKSPGSTNGGRLDVQKPRASPYYHSTKRANIWGAFSWGAHQQTVWKGGFRNNGNTCYVNASLQALLALSCFKTDIRAHKEHHATPVFNSLREVVLQLDDMKSGTVKGGALNVTSVKQSVSRTAKLFSGREQQDAHEFINYLLDQIYEEISKESSLPSRNRHMVCPVSRNFSCTVEHVRTCLNSQCKDVSPPQRELLRNFSLTTDESGLWPIEHLITQFFQDTIVEYTCDKCGHKESQISHRVVVLPRVLVIHLKRFEYRVAEKRHVKIDQPVIVSPQFSMIKFCIEGQTKLPPVTPLADEARRSLSFDGSTSRSAKDEPRHSSSRSNSPGDDDGSPFNVEVTPVQKPVYQDHDRFATDKSGNYRLISMIRHSGQADSGHYTTDAYNETKEQWKCYNDSIVTEVSPSQVYGESRQRGCYVMFYVLQDADEPIVLE